MTIAGEFAKAFKAVGKDLRKEKKRRERDARAAARYETSSWDRTTQKEAVFGALPRAIAAASGNGEYAVPARNLYYALRPLIQGQVEDLQYNYFSQTLLTEYQEVFGEIDGLVRDPRGNLHEPHSGKTIPLGTQAINGYEFPDHVYDKILYVEKEGLTPIFQTAKLPERFDLAIAAGKGLPVEAVRHLFARAESGNYQLFVLHDADPDGYKIARTIAEETRRMPDHCVDVIDLGLTVADAVGRGLQTEQFTRRKALPWWMTERLTNLEAEWFQGERLSYRRQWACTRVELNALTAPDLVAFVEEGLAQHGATGKVVPPEDLLVETAKENHRDKVADLVERVIADVADADELIDTVVGETKDVAETDVAQLTAALKDNPPEPWRQVVLNQIDARLDSKRQQKVRDRVRALLEERLGGVE